MRHDRLLVFEALESRKLLSKTHPAVAHAVPVVSTLMLGGTLAVDNQAATMTVDGEGDTMTSTPVSGVLGTLGKVRGVWNEASDSSGDILGPDTLRIRDPQGAFVVAFNTAGGGKVQHLKGGAVSYEVPETLRVGTGTYAKASQSGSIELVTNNGKSQVVKMTLNTTNP